MTGTAALAALLARLAADDRREQQRQEEADRLKARNRLTARLYTWGEWQREGYDLSGTDYARPRVIGNAPASKMPAPEWYITLVAAIATLPHADQQALRWTYVVGDGNTAGRAFEALLTLVGED